MFIMLFFFFINIFFINLNSKEKDLPINIVDYYDPNYIYFPKCYMFSGFGKLDFKGDLLGYSAINVNNRVTTVFLTNFGGAFPKNIVEVSFDPYLVKVEPYWKISPDGSLFAIANKKEIDIYSANTGEKTATFVTPNKNCYCDFSQSARYFFNINYPGKPNLLNGNLWDLESEVSRPFEYKDSVNIQNVKFWPVLPKFIKSSDGSTRLLTIKENNIYLYDCATGNQIFSTSVNGIIYDLSYDVKNERIIVALSKPIVPQPAYPSIHPSTLSSSSGTRDERESEFQKKSNDWWQGHNFRILNCYISVEKKQQVIASWVEQCRGVVFSDDSTQVVLKFRVDDDVEAPGKMYLYKVRVDGVSDLKILDHPADYQTYEGREYEALQFVFNETGDKLISSTNFLKDPTIRESAIIWNTNTGQVINKLTFKDQFFDVCTSEGNIAFASIDYVEVLNF